MQAYLILGFILFLLLTIVSREYLDPIYIFQCFMFSLFWIISIPIMIIVVIDEYIKSRERGN